MKKRERLIHVPPWISIGIAVLGLTLLLAPTASAADGNAAVDWAGFCTYLGEQFTCCNGEIEITAYGIEHTEENMAQMSTLIYHEMPEYFHVSAFSVTYQNATNTCVKLKPTYSCTAAEYAAQREACDAAVEAMVRDIRGNSSLTDVQKALLLHDRLAVHCEYNTENIDAQSAHSMYGAMVERKAVCEGYAEAYDYLLSQVGIESTYCSSAALGHAWNIVEIDGKRYHVDVTWDDPIADMVGRVKHTNFMLSSTALYAAKHTASDYDTTPADTTYDNAFWQSSTTAFQLIDGQLYYVDNENAVLKTYTGRTLQDVTAVWRASATSRWNGNYTKLSSDGKRLFYSQPDGVYEYNLAAQTAERVYAPELSAGNYEAVYGFRYDDGEFVCDIYHTPNFDGAQLEIHAVCPPRLVKLEGLVSSFAPQSTVSLSLVQSGQTKYSVQLAAEADTGRVSQQFTFSGVEAGTYDLVIRKWGHLSVTVADIQLDADLDLTQSEDDRLANILLPCGDVNGDERIDLFDVALVRASADGTYDLNGDHVCDQTDVGIVRQNNLCCVMKIPYQE